MSKSPKKNKKNSSFSASSLPSSPTADEKCSLCDKKGNSFNEQWIGCLGCPYWVCVDCAFRELPGYDLIQGKMGPKKNVIYKSVSSIPNAPWQYLCPSCITGLSERKVDSRETSPVDIPKVSRTAINVLQNDFNSKILSLTSVISNIDSQIKELKSSIDTKVGSWSDVVKKNQNSPSLTEVIQNTAKTVAKQMDVNKILIFSRIPETGSLEKDRDLMIDFIKGLDVEIEDHRFRDVVRLGRPNKDIKRLVKVTFVNELSVRVLMAARRQCINEGIQWCQEKKFFEKDAEGHIWVSYRNFGLRTDLPKESRDILKMKANKVYRWNTEIRSEAETNGNEAKVSFSLRQDGNIWRFARREDKKWIKDKHWTYSDQENI